MSTEEQYVKAPRSVFIDFFLVFITLSLFVCVWIYQAARDINRIKPQGFQPWLWIFVPLFLLPQFFALPKLTSALQEAEAELEIDTWSKSQDIAWIVSVIAMTILIMSTSVMSLSLFVEILIIYIWLAMFLLIGPRVNRVRQASSLPKTKLVGQLSNIEWGLAILGTPLFIALVWYGGLKTHFDTIEKLGANQHIDNAEYGFSLRTADDAWQRVEIGTLSDGTAVLELSGYSDQASIVVFIQDDIDSISEITQWRIQELKESWSNVECNEHRKLEEDGVLIRAQLLCMGRFMLDQAMQMHEILQLEDDIYVEVYAELSASKSEFQQHKANFINTVRSIQAIDKEE